MPAKRNRVLVVATEDAAALFTDEVLGTEMAFPGDVATNTRLVVYGRQTMTEATEQWKQNLSHA